MGGAVFFAPGSPHHGPGVRCCDVQVDLFDSTAPGPPVLQVQLLLQKGVRPTEVDDGMGYSALHEAALCDMGEAVEALIAGASPSELVRVWVDVRALPRPQRPPSTATAGVLVSPETTFNAKAGRTISLRVVHCHRPLGISAETVWFP